jgi:hypothetical protein
MKTKHAVRQLCVATLLATASFQAVATAKILKILAANCIISCFLFPVGLQNADDVQGVWFSEINQEKSIYIFAGTEGSGTQVTVLEGSGAFRTVTCKIYDERSVGRNEAAPCTYYFPENNILIFRSRLFPSPIVLKRLQNPSVLQEVDRLLIRRQSDRTAQPAGGADRSTLAAEIKGSISWDLLHLSAGEFLGWLSKEKKTEQEKQMRETGREMKFPISHHEDINGLAMIKGRWQFNKKHIFIFSDAPAGEAMGVKLYRLGMIDRPGYEGYDSAYTILVHEDDQRSYLYIVFWQWEFQTPNRIEFPEPDRLLTFREGILDAEAIRLKE